MNEVYVHSHALRHGLTEDEILYAWSNFVRSQWRDVPNENQILRIGYGKETYDAIQMIGVMNDKGIVIIHAMAPPQKSVLDEVGIPRR